jgi:hypothetical protein
MDLRQGPPAEEQQQAGGKARPRLQYLLPVHQLPQNPLQKEELSGRDFA